MESSRRAEDERTAVPLEESEGSAAESPAPAAAEWLPADLAQAEGSAPEPSAPRAAAPPPAARPAAAPPPAAPSAVDTGDRSPAQAAPDVATRQERIERRVEDVLRLQEQNGRQQSALTAAVESLRGRVEELERRLAELSSREQRGDPLERAAGYQEAHSAGSLPADGELIDLNAADFDQLRALGLSITQAARLIARRDSVNGFSSEAEVAALPGFPQSMLQDLLSKTRL